MTGRSSLAFSAGDVVLVPFPYRDRLAERARPAVVVSAAAYNQHGDVVVAAITSHAPRLAMDFALMDWAAAGLKLPSTVVATGTASNMGLTTSAALTRLKQTGQPYSGSGTVEPMSAGNGCLMRLAPVPMFFYPDDAAAIRFEKHASRWP
jgi:mRNA-degrading endonuclease toxin of MazEF toxin-antitoxin module